VKAIVKTVAAPGLEWLDVPEPELGPGQVLLRVEHASICGTDLHIEQWDRWAAGRIRPPRRIGHEFCGTVLAVGDGVETHQVGDFVASESHIVCGHCRQCREGQAHVCVNTVILGVDVDGGFSPRAVVPAANARPVPRSVPQGVASMLDALGNAVHTAMAGPLAGQTVLITGLGPIGLFAVAICRAMGAEKIVGTEISSYRIAIAEELGIDAVLNPQKDAVASELGRIAPAGFDATLEMSGHPSSLDLALDHTRPGGRISLLGVFPGAIQNLDLNKAIFKGIDLQGIAGRRLDETWDQMTDLLTERGLNVLPVITHHFPAPEFPAAFDILRQGQAGKIVLDFEGV